MYGGGGIVANENSDNSKEKQIKEVDLGESVVTITKSQNNPYQSKSVIERGLIESSPSGNGDIGSLLRILPNVQFNNTQLSSNTPGEIDAANISISGGLYYQNNFLLDGFNINNDLDPANSKNASPLMYDSITGGQSQGLNIDTSLLESIQVQDSNISASYGGFNGGVVEANTKRAKKLIGGNISYQITQGNANPSKSSLTKYHIYAPDNDEYQDFLNSSNANNQPEFTKHIFRSSIESKFATNAGVIASFTTTQSFIPLNGYSQNQITQTTDKVRKIQKRQNYNFYIKGHYDIGESLRLEANYGYMPQFNEYFIVNTKDSGFSMLSGGHQVGIKGIWDNKFGILTAQSSFNHLQGSRSNAQKDLKTWRYSTDKNWNPNGTNGFQAEGSYGNADQKQLTFNLKIVQDFNPLALIFGENNIHVGFEMGYVNAFYERKENTYYSGTLNSALAPMTQNQICTDTNWCSNGIVDVDKLPSSQKRTWANNNGQYIKRVSLLKAGKINIDNVVLGAFIEDSIHFDLGNGGDINARFGLRLDYDTYMNKAPIAPRFSLSYEAPWGKWESSKEFATRFTFGANRYYGRNLYTYKLMAARESFRWTLVRNDEQTSWDNAQTQTQTKTTTDFKQLKVPYSDEFVGGVSQQFYVFDINAKYIHRFGKDEIVGSCIEKDEVSGTCKFMGYDNHGESNSGIFSFSIQNNKLIETWGVTHHYLFAFDLTNLKRNFADYTDTLLDSSINDEWISYDGKLMRFRERPAENFARPYTLRLNTTHSFTMGQIKWLWNNFFRYRSPYQAMAEDLRNKDSYIIDGVLTEVDTWRVFNVPWAFTWDMRVGFEVDIYKGNTFYMNLDVYNVLNRKNLTIDPTTNIRNLGVPVYEVGRQLWIQLGYKF